MTDKIVILSTCADLAEAERIAHSLVKDRLAACVNVIPGLKSIYRWKGAIEESSEHLLVVKTSRELFEKVQNYLSAVHSYEVPEAIALPIVDGAPNYLNWLAGELRGAE